MQLTNLPPLPCLPEYLPQGTPVYLLSTNGVYIYDDRGFDYGVLHELVSATAAPLASNGLDQLGKDWTTNDLWLEITGATNDLVYLVLHGTRLGNIYQLWSKVRLTDKTWTPGQIRQDMGGTNTIFFDPVPTRFRDEMFFRASGPANCSVGVTRPPMYPDPQEPRDQQTPGRYGVFWVSRLGSLETNLTVLYRMGGAASNGIDYTNMPGQITIPAGVPTLALIIQPLWDDKLEFDESVIVTLLPGTGYTVIANQASARLYIEDNLGTNVIFQNVASGLQSPTGIDYHPTTGSLILSVAGPSSNFVSIGADGRPRPWSGAYGAADEVKLVTAKQTTNGFTAGEAFFAADLEMGGSNIGEIGPFGDSWTSSWCTLPGETDNLRGSLCMDSTGSWLGDLIVVTGDEQTLPGTRGVWRVGANRQPTLITRIGTQHLEGVVTVSNSYEAWGPFSGNIITGDEDTHVIYAIDQNALVESFSLGIDVEDIDVVQDGQNLYCINYNWAQSRLLKVRKELFEAHRGQLLLTQAGEVTPERALFLLCWDGYDLTTWRVLLPASFSGHFEHVTFAPISLSPVMP